MNFLDRTGFVVGRLTVVEHDSVRSRPGIVFWRCRCACGKIVSVRSGHLGDTKKPVRSCGCLAAKTHRGKRHPWAARRPRSRIACKECAVLFVPIAGNDKFCGGCKATRAAEHHRASMRARRGKWPRYQSFYNLRANYGLSEEDYLKMEAAIGGLCPICTQPPQPHGKYKHRFFAVDHDHTTGKVRGLLCGRCNAGLGQFADSTERLAGAIRYLETHRADSSK